MEERIKILSAELGHILRSNSLEICTAESCTAGGIGNAIAATSGASEYLCGGVITYAVEAKEKLLGVEELTICKNNVVSSNVALEMALGAIKLFSADIAVSVTGLAGPNDVDGMPAGTIYVCVALKSRPDLANPDVINIRNLDPRSTDREVNIRTTIAEALNMTILTIKQTFGEELNT